MKKTYFSLDLYITAERKEWFGVFKHFETIILIFFQNLILF